MKILLAGPGTGKTKRIKTIIDEEFSDAQKIIVLSFTNFTVNDLTKSFLDNDRVACSTLHSFALGLNHEKNLYIATATEERILKKLSDRTQIDLADICELLRCITFDGMIEKCAAFIKANSIFGRENRQLRFTFGR